MQKRHGHVASDNEPLGEPDAKLKKFEAHVFSVYRPSLPPTPMGLTGIHVEMLDAQSLTYWPTKVG